MGFQATALIYDPYRKFKFLVKWNGVYVMVVYKVSSIIKSIDAIDWWIGGDFNFSVKVFGFIKWEPITLECGLLVDFKFQDWMIEVNQYIKVGGQDGEAVHKFRKHLQIEMYSLQNELVLTINVYNAWLFKLTVADFDVKVNELVIEYLELQNEGWDLIFGFVVKLLDERPVVG